MNFLRQEVQREEIVNLLPTGFASNQNITQIAHEGIEIDILIGADILPQLMISKSINLVRALLASKLGWCGAGKTNGTCNDINSLTTLEMHVSNVSLSNFWKLKFKELMIR
ncbi:hypothetical protein AVEN_66663-1 [Araneus ventricosus]|uniref:Peptidase aspartic putative domain-containing protein n=1 Tax=Araneus ventricosus TaxID=182803 RepID=A0A4Y2V0F7_ARAVE|nr:hypothetical protein AVEN_66663-1 [Araneus ventricosus]